MIRKLQIKIVCVTMVLVTLMLTLMLVLQYHATSESLESSSISALQAAAMRPMTPSRPGFGGPTQPCFSVAWMPGGLLATGDDYYDLSDTALLQEIYRAAAATEMDYGVLVEYNLRFLRHESHFELRYVFTDITAEILTLKTFFHNCIFIGVFSFFAFLVLSILLARWITRPVEKAWLQQRQFVADASHELKTPLTVILTNAELLQDSRYGADARGQFAENILAMSHQMRGLVESLLQLARADCGQSKAEANRLNVSCLVEDAVLPFEPVYYEQGLVLESRIAPDLFVSGSEAHLKQVVEILLDNAQKYSTPGGTVQLVLEKQGRSCLLSVSSPGRELTAKECRDIFKRFYRADQARSMNHSYGLGLAIAQRIVDDHRGKIWAESANGVNIFHVSLPLV